MWMLQGAILTSDMDAILISDAMLGSRRAYTSIP